MHALHGGLEPLVGSRLLRPHVGQDRLQPAEAIGDGRVLALGADRVGDAAGGALRGGLDRRLVAQERDLGQEVAHGALQARQGRVAAPGVDAACERQHLPLEAVQGLAARPLPDPVELVGEAAQHAVDRREVAARQRRLAQGVADLLQPIHHVADGGHRRDLIDLGREGVDAAEDGAGGVRLLAPLGPQVVELAVELGDALRQGRRVGAGRPHALADLLQQRPQLVHQGRAVEHAVPEPGDGLGEFVDRLGEILHPGRLGENREPAADLVEFAEQLGDRVAIGETGAVAAHRPVHLLGQALDVLGHAGMDVGGDVLGEAADLDPHQVDRPGDGDEVGRLAGPLHLVGQGADRVLQGHEVAAGGERADRIAQARGLGLQPGDRRGEFVGGGLGRFHHPGEVAPQAVDQDLLILLGGAVVELLLALADFRHRGGEAVGRRPAAPAGRPRCGLERGALGEMGLDALHRLRDGLVGGIAARADALVDRVEAPADRRHRLDQLRVAGRSAGERGGLRRGNLKRGCLHPSRLDRRRLE